jgi:hypothetical protein
VKNLDFGKLVIVGGKPDWCRPDLFIEGPTEGSRRHIALENIKIIVRCNQITDDIFLMNDDFYIMREMRGWRPEFNYYRGLLYEQYVSYWKVFGHNKYVRKMLKTLKYFKLKNVLKPVSYDLHIPFRCSRTRLRRILGRRSIKGLLIRTTYGNLYSIEAGQVRDGKVYKAEDEPPRLPFLSSSDGSFQQGKIGKYIRKMFPEASKYERSGNGEKDS